MLGRVVEVVVARDAMGGLRDEVVGGMLLMAVLGVGGGAEEAKGPVGEVEAAEDEEEGEDLCEVG